MIRYAVVGIGHIGKRHTEVITRNSESELVALIDIDPSKKIYAEQLELPFYTSLEDFLKADVEADIINIATPNYLHAPQAMLALEAGHHVLIEKPMTLNKADALALIELAEKKQKHIFTVMQNRYSPPAQWLKEIMSNQVLGKIYMVQMNCFWNRDERYYTKDSWHGKLKSDGGVLFTQFSHFVDTLYWLLGDLELKRAELFNFNHAETTEFSDSGILHFKSKEGAEINMNFSTSVYEQNLESSITLIAEHGSVKVGGQYMNRVEYCNIKDYQYSPVNEANPANNYGAYQGSAQNHDHVIQNVNDVLLRNAQIMTGAQDGLAVVKIIEEVYAQF